MPTQLKPIEALKERMSSAETVPLTRSKVEEALDKLTKSVAVLANKQGSLHSDHAEAMNEMRECVKMLTYLLTEKRAPGEQWEVVISPGRDGSKTATFTKVK